MVPLSLILLGALACDSGAPANKNAKATSKQAPVPPQAKQPEPPPVQPEIQPTQPAVEPAPVEAAPVEAAPTELAPVEPAPTEPSPTGWTPPQNLTDIRSDAAIPPGTAAANAAAYKKLPVAKGDGPPVGGIGANGIHFDVLEVGRGWEKSRCTGLTSDFAVPNDLQVNICMRIVHPRGETEELTVEWEKNGGAGTRRSKVTVKDMHAYLTRSYLPIKEGYQGDWTATIKTADGTVLGKVAFKVQ
jgi:Protein of unknown function (DUF2914)